MFWRHCVLKQNNCEVTKSFINFHTYFSCHQKFILFNPLLYFAARNYYVKDLAHKFYGGFIIIIILPPTHSIFLLGLIWPELGFFLIFSLSLGCCLTLLLSILDGIHIHTSLQRFLFWILTEKIINCAFLTFSISTVCCPTLLPLFIFGIVY